VARGAIGPGPYVPAFWAKHGLTDHVHASTRHALVLPGLVDVALGGQRHCRRAGNGPVCVAASTAACVRRCMPSLDKMAVT
jgi:hypothetical protein